MGYLTYENENENQLIINDQIWNIIFNEIFLINDGSSLSFNVPIYGNQTRFIINFNKTQRDAPYVTWGFDNNQTFTFNFDGWNNPVGEVINNPAIFGYSDGHELGLLFSNQHILNINIVHFQLLRRL